MSKEPLYENGIQGKFWFHTAYGGDDYDSMGFCDLDDEKVQTVGVNVEMPTGRVNFHMNCDRLGYVDPEVGEREFKKVLAAARLFVAAPDLLAVLVDLLDATERIDGHEDLLGTVEHAAREVIALAQGGEE